MVSISWPGWGQQPAATRVQRIVSHSLAAQLLRSAKRSCRFGLGYRGEACTSDSLKVWRSWLLHAVPAVVAWPMGCCCGAGAGACLTGSRGAGGGERAAGWGSKRRRRRGRRGAGQAGRRALLQRVGLLRAALCPVAYSTYYGKYIHTVVYCAGGCVSSRHHHQQADPVEYVHTFYILYSM